MEDRELLTVKEAPDRGAGAISELKVIDIGCGSGRVTENLVGMGAHVTGVEPNFDALRRARDSGRATYLEDTGEETGQPDDTFDIAVFSESLHHARNRFVAIEQAARIVSPGGRITVQVEASSNPSDSTATQTGLSDTVRFEPNFLRGSGCSVRPT